MSSTLGVQDPNAGGSPISTPPISTGGVDNTPQSPNPGGGSATAPGPQPTSRLGLVIQAVSTALQGIPDRGRPSFITGLGEGARSEQQAEATQQAIKFRNFDDSVRAAQLHNQDLELQLHTQAQSDAHQQAQDVQHDWDEAHGIQYDEIPNSGQAVTDHLTAQTAAQGSASVPPGTHLSADGKTILIPRPSDETQTGQLQKYNTFRAAYGLPSLPQGAQFVPGKLVDMLQNRLEGHKLDGNVYNHDDLPGAIADLQANRDSLAKDSSTDPAVLKQLDATIGSMQSKLDYLDTHKAAVLKQASQATTAGKVAGETSPDAIAGAAKKAGAVASAKLPSEIALQNAKSTGELNAVAYDPNYQNPDGTKGANVVMNKADAQAKGLTHYKADPSTINTVVAGMNDVQNKLNQLAGVVNDRQKMSQVDPALAAAMLAHGAGITLSFGGHGGGASGGIGIDTSKANEVLYGHDVFKANQATRDFVSAFIGAHEAITQLPRLQTFGKSNRMTESQMQAAINLLPQPGDREFAAQKMTSLQGMIDPLRKQIPHMPGADQIPSWLDQRKQRVSQSSGSKLGKVVVGNATDFINSLQPANQ